MIIPSWPADLDAIAGVDETLARAGRARTPAGSIQTPVPVRLELTPADAIADHDLAGCAFGLQGPDRSLVPGEPGDGDRLSWTCLVVLVHGTDAPVRWIGHYVHGRAGDEFFYLAWEDRMRIKAQLRSAERSIGQITAAEHPLLNADLTGRVPHDRTPVRWQVTDLATSGAGR